MRVNTALAEAKRQFKSQLPTWREHWELYFQRVGGADKIIETMKNTGKIHEE